MELTLNTPLDMHLHFREGEMLKRVAPLSAKTFAGGVIMPNLVPPVDSLDRLQAYRDEVLAGIDGEVFEPYMTLFFREYSEAELVAAKPHIIGIKLYPVGVTTNSESGVSSLKEAEPTLEIMQALEIPLLIHGETQGFVMDREKEFVSVYKEWATKFPRLKITMEHITTCESVALLKQHENLRATVTLQHLLITLDDVAGGLLDPHLFCKPIAKRPEDREKLLEIALSGYSRLMFGSDSAPHPVDKKECCGCAAGVFTAPVALQMLAELFDQHGALDRLQAFVSDNARALYGVNPPAKSVQLVRSDYEVPDRYGDVVPIKAGKTIAWSVKP